MRPKSILLIGPTGSGKTPLGEFLEANGLRDRRCVHLDFGAELRASAAKHKIPGLSAADLTIIRNCLLKGALLERKDFHVAEVVFSNFLKRHAVGPEDMLVLNGLPRHARQAQDVDRVAIVALVVLLECDARTITTRIACNSGGDRTGRSDDDPAAVHRKLAMFAERTYPLVEYYREQGIPVVTLHVEVSTTPQQMAAQLSRKGVKFPPCH